MEEVKITFASGEVLTATKNATTYIVDEKPTISDLSEVTIEGDETSETLSNVEMIECASLDEKYCFALRELPETEVAANQIRSDVDYLLLMSE